MKPLSKVNPKDRDAQPVNRIKAARALGDFERAVEASAIGSRNWNSAQHEYLRCRERCLAMMTGKVVKPLTK